MRICGNRRSEVGECMLHFSLSLSLDVGYGVSFHGISPEGHCSRVIRELTTGAEGPELKA